MTTAFVLSGGVSLGAIQVGMLQALSRHNIRPSLLDDAGVRSLLRRHLRFDSLEEAPTPLHVVAVHVLSGRDVRLSSGDAIDAITASAAIPGIFAPVSIGGDFYMDGGVVNNTPLSHAVELGADIVWVLPTGYSCFLSEPPESALGMALHGLAVLVQHRLAADVAHYEHVVDLRVVPPLCPVTVSPADFSQTAELIDRARSATEAWLAFGPTPTNQAALLEPHTHGPGGDPATAGLDRSPRRHSPGQCG